MHCNFAWLVTRGKDQSRCRVSLPRDLSHNAGHDLWVTRRPDARPHRYGSGGRMNCSAHAQVRWILGSERRGSLRKKTVWKQLVRKNLEHYNRERPDLGLYALRFRLLSVR